MGRVSIGKGVSFVKPGTGGIEIEGPISIETTRVAVDTQTDGSVSDWAMTDTSIPRTFTIGTVDEVTDRILTFTDESLNAGTNNITIDTQGASLIDGAASVVISVDGGGVSVKFDSTNWKDQP